jgi:hypothetical protein
MSLRHLDSGSPPLPEPVSAAPPQQNADLIAQPTLSATLASPTLTYEATRGTLTPLYFRSLRCGCYLINYTPNNSLLTTYDGTLRVECHSNGRTASGDLYQRPQMLIAYDPYVPIPTYPSPYTYTPTLQPQLVLAPAPNPGAGIPIFSRGRYRYYLRVTQILEYYTFGNSFTLGLQMYRFTAPNTWTFEGDYTAVMSWSAAPLGYPSSSDYLTGDVRNSANTVVGRLSMGWVSSYLRKVTVEIDRVSASEAPLNNGAGIDWLAVFNAVNWQVTLDVSDSNLTEPSGESWSDAELHAAMLARRDAANLDAEWRYHILAVRRLDSTTRGIMYDAYASDSNNVPREGASLSSHWTIPDTSTWGLVRGLRFGAAASPYFRTAIHEIGHAFGLYHNTVDLGFMNTTDVIAGAGTATTPFPNNVQWSFAPDDLKRLRHYPDVFVRPGVVPFGSASNATPPITPTDDLKFTPEALELRVMPMLDTVPLGAPIRANIELINISDRPVLVPANIGLKHGFTHGTVKDPAGNVRTFRPLLHCVEEHELRVLEPGQSIGDSLTLLRGGEGALFPASGGHTIEVEVHWPAGEAEVVVTGSAPVMVTPAVDVAHAKAANAVLAEPDTLLTLVIGGDHLENGIAAIRSALNSQVLRPHFAYVEAKRVAKRFGKRKPDWAAVASLIDEETVMSSGELRKARGFVDAAGTAAPAKQIEKALDRASKVTART